MAHKLLIQGTDAAPIEKAMVATDASTLRLGL